MADRPLEGRHALIPGGGTGIGAATAEALHASGARVSLLGRRMEPLLHRFPTLFPSTCLYRSLARYALYRGAQIPVTLKLGVRRQGADELIGHAWLDLDGAPLGEEIDPRLRLTYVYPPQVTR